MDHDRGTRPAAAAPERTTLGARFARVARVLVTAILFGVAASAAAQSQFRSDIVFSAEPPTYDAGAFFWARLELNSDTANISNLEVDLTLPAGIKFQGDVYTTCGGTLVQPDDTHMSLTGGAFLVNNGCYVVVYMAGWPATSTDYVLDFGTILYSTPTNNFTHFPSAVGFTVLGGIPPTFSDALLDDGSVGLPYYFSPDWLLDMGTQPVAWSMSGLPPGLSYDPTQGGIVGTPTKEGSYNVQIHGDNTFPPPADGTFALVIHPAPLQSTKSFAPSSIANGETSTMTIALHNTEAYDMHTVAFTDAFPPGMAATNPGTFGVCGGTVTVTGTSLSLADGLVAAGATCTITAPVTAEVGEAGTLVNITSTVDVVIGNGEGTIEGTMPAASGGLDVSVGIAPVITSPPPASSIVGAPYVWPVTVTGTAPIDVSASGLPPGLFYASGAIRGTASIAGIYPGTIVASNGFKPDAVQHFILKITATDLAIITDKLPPISGGTDVDTPIVAKGGQPPYKFDLLLGALPPGLSFDPTGFLKGIPIAPGTFAFTARVTDASGSTATRAYVIVIDKATPAITLSVSPNPGVIGQTVIAKATLSGPMGVAGGDLQVWVAGSGERCPQVAGGQPVTLRTASAALATGSAQVSFADLGIDHFQVCASYGGDSHYKIALAGPYDLFIIKGALLPTPTVTLSVPERVRYASTVPAQVTVSVAPGSALAPSGSVLLRVDGKDVGTVTLDKGVANFSALANVRDGAMEFSAAYLGDGAFSPAVATKLVAVGDIVDPASAIPALSDAALAALMAAMAAAGALALRARRRLATKATSMRARR